MAVMHQILLAIGLALLASPAWACTYGTHVAGCDDSITATTPALVASKRASLINNAWGSGANGLLPTTPATVTTISTDGVTGNPMNPNAPTSCVMGTVNQGGIQDTGAACPWWPMQTQRVDRFTTAMSNNQSQQMLFFFAAASNNKHRFIAINPGHSNTCHYEKDASSYNMMPVTLGLLNAGYSVLQMTMPIGIGSTGGFPTPVEPGGCGAINNHNWLFTTYGDVGMHYFFEPLTQVINYLATAPPSYFPDGKPFTDYNIAGLSGGGWTCTQYAALDTRIRNAICVAGSTPGLYFADANNECPNADYEQCSANYYTIAGWLDLYALASQGVGRQHRQILNQGDDCCFGVNQWTGAPPTGATFSSFQQYYSAGQPGAAQCGSPPPTTCTWATYINNYSSLITANLPNIAPANNPAVIKDQQAHTHTITTCTSATGGNAAFHGTTACTGTSIDGGTTPQIDALSVIIATLDGNPVPLMVMAGGTRGLRLGGR
jgi:hypothetical protein